VDPDVAGFGEAVGDVTLVDDARNAGCGEESGA
jgi:hypothetical protein